MDRNGRLHRWLFRRGPDRQHPIHLDRRRIFILPTGTGLAYAGMLALMLIGAINYNLSLGHALVFLLAALGLVTMLHTFGNLSGLSLAACRVEPVFAGETARIPVDLVNDRQHARHAITLHFFDTPAVSIDIPAEGSIRLELPFTTHRRGHIAPGPMTLESRYPLGFFRAWSHPWPPIRCLVYPSPEEHPLPLPRPVSDPGQTRGEGGQEDFSGFRFHQPADSPQHIAWKAVARNADNQPLLVKLFSGGADEELWLDWQLLTDIPDEERRLSILAGWILAAEAAALPYGLSIPGWRKSPGRGPAHRAACLEALALHGRDVE